MVRNKKTLETTTKNIRECKELSKRNRSFILDFRNYIIAFEKLSDNRVISYLWRLKKLSLFLNKNFDRLTEHDLINLITKLDEMGYTESTKTTFQKMLKKFMRWLYKKKVKRKLPDFITNLKVKDTTSYKMPEEILTPEEVKKLIDCAKNIRDKAFISMLYEGGFRAGEILSLKIKDLSFEDGGVVVKINKDNTKTERGHRTLFLIESLPYLNNYLEIAYPDKKEDNDYLWISRNRNKEKTKMAYSTIKIILKGISKKAGITKRIYPHIFRHSRATFFAKQGWNEAKLCNWFGWRAGSKMPAVYIHLSNNDAKEDIKKLYGKLNKKCHKCGAENTPDRKFCLNCTFPLDFDAIVEEKEKEREFLKFLTNPAVKRKIVDLIKEDLGKIKV